MQGPQAAALLLCTLSMLALTHWVLCSRAAVLLCRVSCTHLRGVHDLLPNVNFPEGLEQRQNRQIEALPRAFPIALLMEPAIYNRQQAEHTHS